MVSVSHKGVIWEISRAVEKRNAKRAIELIDSLIAKNENAVGLIKASIIPTVRNLFFAKLDLSLWLGQPGSRRYSGRPSQEEGRHRQHLGAQNGLGRGKELHPSPATTRHERLPRCRQGPRDLGHRIRAWSCTSSSFASATENAPREELPPGSMEAKKEIRGSLESLTIF
jgi:hypothetical protein